MLGARFLAVGLHCQQHVADAGCSVILCVAHRVLVSGLAHLDGSLPHEVIKLGVDLGEGKSNAEDRSDRDCRGQVAASPRHQRQCQHCPCKDTQERVHPSLHALLSSTERVAPPRLPLCQ